MGNKSCYNSSL